MTSGPLTITASILILVAKRLRNSTYLTLARFFGLAFAVAFLCSLPLFAAGTGEKLLRDRLRIEAPRPIGTVWLVHWTQFNSPRVSLNEYRLAEQYVRTNLEYVVDLPIEQLVSYIGTNTHFFWPADEGASVGYSNRRPVQLWFQSDLDQHIKFLHGGPLPADQFDPDSGIPAIVHADVATALSLRVGDRYVFAGRDRFKSENVLLSIVGIWDVIDPNDPYWSYDTYLKENAVFVGKGAMLEVIFNQLPEAQHEFSWYALADVDYITVSNANRVRSGLIFLERRMIEYLPEAKLRGTDLTDLLNTVEPERWVLNLLMLILGLPVMAATIYYIAVSFNMVLERQSGEIALLKSRGTSPVQVTGIYVVEWLLMGSVAFVGGPFVGQWLAQVTGQTYGFLLFAQRPALNLEITPQVVHFAAAGVGVALLATIGPAIIAARQSIVAYKREATRSTVRPFWQRYFLDFLLLAAAGYGYLLLNQRQTFQFIEGTTELIVDPLLLVTPAISIIATAMIFIRSLPLLAAGSTLLASYSSGPSIMLAFRQISRVPGHYVPLILLLIVTIALGTYNASTAHTIDRNFREQVYYRIPGDLVLHERWIYVEETESWLEPPFYDHYLPGVQGAVTVREYEVFPVIGSQRGQEARLLAVDRTQFPKVSWWRSDFAEVALGALMNTLAVDQSGLLADRKFLQHYGLQVGDRVTLSYKNQLIEFNIAESIDFFPGLDPRKGFIFVANIDYLYDIAGQEPYQVWLKVDQHISSGELVDALHRKRFHITKISDSRVEVGLGRTHPQRTGLFGVLSIGFILGAALTVLAFFLYAFLTFERRVVQLGILRAIGMSVRQLITLTVFEHVFLLLLGAVAGTAIGLLATYVFIPFFRLGVEDQLPPFVITTAWEDIGRLYVVIGIILVLGLAGILWLIRRMNLSRAVKLGEEQ